MAVNCKMFGQTLLKAMNKEIKWNAVGGDTFKVLLYAGTIPANAQDTWVYKSDVNTIVEVVQSGGYLTGGSTLTGLTTGYNASTNTISFDANDVLYSSSTISASCALIVDDTGNASTSVLVGMIDFGTTNSSSNGDFKIVWDSLGIVTISCS